MHSAIVFRRALLLAIAVTLVSLACGCASQRHTTVFCYVDTRYNLVYVEAFASAERFVAFLPISATGGKPITVLPGKETRIILADRTLRVPHAPRALSYELWWVLGGDGRWRGVPQLSPWHLARPDVARAVQIPSVPDYERISQTPWLASRLDLREVDSEGLLDRTALVTRQDEVYPRCVAGLALDPAGTCTTVACRASDGAVDACVQAVSARGSLREKTVLLHRIRTRVVDVPGDPIPHILAIAGQPAAVTQRLTAVALDTDADYQGATAVNVNYEARYGESDNRLSSSAGRMAFVWRPAPVSAAAR